jgi:MFS transporter, SP family, solute carrier family 2 (myo-inositol transporter), member 13
MMKSLTPSGAFGFYAAICGIGWVWIIFFYLECSCFTLEEISQVFKLDFGVIYARQLREDRKEIYQGSSCSPGEGYPGWPLSGRNN